MSERHADAEKVKLLSMRLHRRPLDLILVTFFVLFAFTSLVMEPYFVFGLLVCRALGSDLPRGTAALAHHLFASAMVYSTVVYFAIEIIGERGRANLPMVIAINVPYTLVALVLGWRLRRATVWHNTALPSKPSSVSTHPAPDPGAR